MLHGSSLLAVDANKHQRVSVDSPDSPHPSHRRTHHRRLQLQQPRLKSVTSVKSVSSLPLFPVSSQVFSMFLETLVDFITLHRDDLQDWLFVLLTQLLKKMGADLLGSVQAKVQKALDVTRSDFH